MSYKASLIDWVQRTAGRFGVHVQRVENTLVRQRSKYLATSGIDLVIDVGANRGQYVDAIRSSGYGGRILSFEPIPAVFDALAARMAADSFWSGRCCALAQRSGKANFGVSENLASSSLYEVTGTSVAVSAGTARVESIEVNLERLDEIDLGPFRSALLKIDTQGAELDVLRGATRTLEKVGLIECELSFAELYSEQPLYFEVAKFLHEKGYRAVWVERGFQDEGGAMLQVDALFVRANAPG